MQNMLCTPENGQVNNSSSGNGLLSNTVGAGQECTGFWDPLAPWYFPWNPPWMKETFDEPLVD